MCQCLDTLVFFIFRQVRQTVQHTISKDSYFIEGQQTDVIKQGKKSHTLKV